MGKKIIIEFPHTPTNSYWTAYGEVTRECGSKARFRRFFKCRCACGVEKEILMGNFLKGRSKSCGGCGSVSKIIGMRQQIKVVCESCSKATNLMDYRIRQLKHDGKPLVCRKCSQYKLRKMEVVICTRCDNTNKIRKYLVSKVTKYLCKPCTLFLRRKEVSKTTTWGNLQFKAEIPTKTNPRKCIFSCSCGGELEAILSDVKSGNTSSCGCWDNKNSKPELEIVDFIKSIGVKNIIRNDRKILNGKELDIYIPDKKLAIEFNGLHWHSERTTPNNYHQEKTKSCVEKGVFLFHVWEDDWECKQHLVKTRITDLMGLTAKGTMARKCERVLLDTKTKNNFLEVNHIQGRCHSSVDLGLKYEGVLRAVMCFKQRSPKVWELVRYATSIKVVGGFSKLLSHFKKSYAWEKIISFADLAWSKGDLYEKTGWEACGILRPDYKYIVNRVRKHKFGFRHCQLKSKLEKYDPNISEHQNMLDNEIYRIYDCGKIRYTLIVKS